MTRLVSRRPLESARLLIKGLAGIFATQITLSADIQVVFDARRRTDAVDTVRRRFFMLLAEGPPVMLGEVVYAVAFLTQAHEYVRTAYLGYLTTWLEKKPANNYMPGTGSRMREILSTLAPCYRQLVSPACWPCIRFRRLHLSGGTEVQLIEPDNPYLFGHYQLRKQAVPNGSHSYSI